uniref:Reverse transcriptase domain-containing protein n=1 Tax=Anolis carolinensis TaxID=28377 RepID=A0A803T0M3_ANOCA
MSGVRGLALQWFNSFLRDQRQRVEWSGQSSESSCLCCGVPQGAILSPLLFNIYVRPLAELVRSFGLECYQYADDTQLLLRLEPGTTTISENFKLCLEAVISWLRASRLKVNPAKTEILWPGQPPELIQSLPDFDGEVLVPSATVKSLGVVLDSSLTMEAQITAISKQAFFHLRQARKLASYLLTEALATVIHATVTTRLDYCNTLYAGLPKTKSHKIQMVQNAEARLLAGSSISSHITPILKQLHWLPIEHRISYKILVLTFRARNGQGPLYLRDRLIPFFHQWSPRSSQENLLYVPGPREVHLEATRRRAFSIYAPILWNSLPPILEQYRSCGLLEKRSKLGCLVVHLSKSDLICQIVTIECF